MKTVCADVQTALSLRRVSMLEGTFCILQLIPFVYYSYYSLSVIYVLLIKILHTLYFLSL